jgi:hypothetical protein
MATIVGGAVISHQPTGKLPVWLVDVEIDGARRSIHVTAPDTIEARKAVAERLGIPFRIPEASVQNRGKAKATRRPADDARQ